MPGVKSINSQLVRVVLVGLQSACPSRKTNTHNMNWEISGLVEVNAPGVEVEEFTRLFDMAVW